MPRLVQQRPTFADANNIAASASSTPGAAAKVTFSAPSSNLHNYLSMVAWSLDIAPSSDQTVTVFDGTSSGTAIYQTSVGSSGFDQVLLPPLQGSPGTQMTVRFSSGSTGKMYLNAYGYVDR